MPHKPPAAQAMADNEVTGTVNQCHPCGMAHSGPINQLCPLAGPEAIAQYVLANNLTSHVATLDDSSESDLTNAQPLVTTMRRLSALMSTQPETTSLPM